jgi:hypothetical protein
MDKGSSRGGFLDLCGPELERCSERGSSRAGRMEHRKQTNWDPWGGQEGLVEAAKKLSHTAIHVAAVEEKPPLAGGSGKRCTFADVLGCPGHHTPWRCGAFGSIQAEERARIIEDHQLWAFCLLHDRAVACRTRENRSKPACGVPVCEGRHAIWLHELLKDIYGKEAQVHLLQGETGWRTSEEAWMEDKREEEEEVMFVNTVRQEEDDWQEPDDSWLELDGGGSEEEAGVYCISTCLRKDDSGVEDFFNATVSFILQLQCIFTRNICCSDYKRVINTIVWYRTAIIC